MAYVPGYKWDIFLSYARLDNNRIAGREPWVDAFLEAVENLLRDSFGRGADELEIFRDVAKFEANSQLPELLDHVRSSALFLAVCSPSYEARDWTRLEMREFWQHAHDAKRLFAIEKRPLDAGLTYPDPLQTHNRVILWKPSPKKNDTVALQPGDPDWFIELHDLSGHIRRKLKAMHDEAPRPARLAEAAPAGTVTPAAPGYRRVLLAQVGESLLGDTKALRLYLESYGVPVRPGGTLPLGGAAFAAAFEAELAQSDLFVQLLSDTAGLQPPDMPQGYPRFQFEAAKAKGIDIIQWRHPEMDFSAIEDRGHAALAGGPHVVAEGFAAFKAMVLRAAAPPPPPEPGPATVAEVFIGTDAMDSAIADQVAGTIASHAFDPFVWERARTFGTAESGNMAEKLRTEREAAMISCDGMTLVYGPNGGRAMAQTLYRQYLKLLGGKRKPQPAKPLAFIYADPNDNDKESSFYRLPPDLLHIHAPDGVTEEVLRPVLQALREHWGNRA